METISIDTTPRAQEVQYRCWSMMSPFERYTRMASFSQQLLNASRKQVDQNWPHLSEPEKYKKFLAIQYGSVLAEKVGEYIEKIR